MPKAFQGLFEGVPSPTYDPDAWQKVKYRDLDAWRALRGWDKSSILTDARIDFDSETLKLSITGGKPLPQAGVVNGIQSDMLGKTTGASRGAGPLANAGVQGSWNVDPRLSA